MARSKMARKRSEPPPTLRAVRVILYVVAAMSAIWSVALVIGYGATTENIGYAIYQLLPAVASVIVARKIANGGRVVRRWIIGLQIVWIVFGLSRLGQGDPSGVLGLVLPITSLVLVTRRTAREYLV